MAKAASDAYLSFIWLFRELREVIALLVHLVGGAEHPYGAEIDAQAAFLAPLFNDVDFSPRKLSPLAWEEFTTGWHLPASNLDPDVIG